MFRVTRRWCASVLLLTLVLRHTNRTKAAVSAHDALCSCDSYHHLIGWFPPVPQLNAAGWVRRALDESVSDSDTRTCIAQPVQSVLGNSLDGSNG